MATENTLKLRAIRPHPRLLVENQTRQVIDRYRYIMVPVLITAYSKARWEVEWDDLGHKVTMRRQRDLSGYRLTARDLGVSGKRARRIVIKERGTQAIGRGAPSGAIWDDFAS